MSSTTVTWVPAGHCRHAYLGTPMPGEWTVKVLCGKEILFARPSPDSSAWGWDRCVHCARLLPPIPVVEVDLPADGGS
ncbi:hypothetical protein GCM10012275_42590 [Longimycelium tulufanense]|uniref:Uncharacterized protein n=1 Tax=Longimycelium tulufanense TaxID=907463 RepID=A0A8J3FVE3_9PSEU|nr:hypothetical protein [Longimycelium tulufanense]GGM67471.1 hypothetical protein GCM10012275_42590 [Longimycelium tulufanense]